MSFFYEVPGLSGWAIMLLVIFALIAFNEFGQTTKWGGILLFLIVPIILTIFVESRKQES
jgi:Ca2+/Na+ antiporter